MISAVVVPLILLAVALAPGLYQDWKTYRRQTRLPLPPARSGRVAGVLGAGTARLRRRMTSWPGPREAWGHRFHVRLQHVKGNVRGDAPPTPAFHSRGE